MKPTDKRKPWPETKIRLSCSRVTNNAAPEGQPREWMEIEAEDHLGRIAFQIRLSMEQYGKLIGGSSYQPVMATWIAARLKGAR